MKERNPAAVDVRTESFGYAGTTSEYFRIWIVSLCLTVITLGIYSAWAKVRKRRYLYRSARLAGASFDYHADPIVILKGRLIAVGALALYAAGGYFVPGIEGLIGLAIFLAVPWLVVRARMFNARYTSYRNLRFRFDPVYGESYAVIMGWNLLAGLTLGLLYPYAHYRRSAMIVNNSHFGNLDFELAEIFRGFYATYLKAAALVLAALVVLGVGATFVPTAADGEVEAGTAAFLLGPVVGLFVAIAAAAAYIGPAITKLVLENSTIGEHRIVCAWNIPRIVFINFTNFAAIAFTLGLAIPWATIRLQRYQFENLSLAVCGDLDAVIATQSDEVSAMGEEFGEAFDIEIGL